MDGVNAVRHILCLTETIFITDDYITLIGIGVSVTACGFQVNFKFCSFFGCFDMGFPVIGVLDKGDISLDNLLDYIIGSQVMLHRVKLRLCADMVNGRIKQIAFARLKLFNRPVISADIFLARKLTVFIGIVHIYKLFALEDTVFCTR